MLIHMEDSTTNMLAIIAQSDEKHGCHLDNTKQFLILMLLKICLDGAALYLCCLKPLRSFLNMCSMSIVVVDFVLAFLMVGTLWLEVHMSHIALCFIMAHFSATYSALPVPMLCLGVLDYYLEDTCAGTKRLKLVRNIMLILLMWTISGIYAHATVQAILLEQDIEVRYLVCEIQESKIVTYSAVVVSMVMFFVLLPYLPVIPQWIKEADQISEAREEISEKRTSDLMLNVTTETNTKGLEEDYQELSMPRPSMHVSMIVGFGVFWMPYLAVTTACVVFDFGVPAYISVNLLWVQCVNSVLVGTLFWLRSDTLGPYNSLPDNVCLWQAYWHLSTGTKAHQLPIAVFNPSKVKRHTPFYV